MRIYTILILMGITFQSFAITLKGKIDSIYNSETDKVYVGIVWHSDDGFDYNPTYSKSIGIVKNGKFKINVDDIPPTSSRKKLENSEFSVAYIFLFKDMDDDQLYSKKDKMIGISETHCITYVSGDLNLDLDNIEKKTGKEIKTFRNLKEGLNLCKAVKPSEHGNGGKFDEIVKVKKAKILINTGVNGTKPKAPNWT